MPSSYSQKGLEYVNPRKKAPEAEARGAKGTSDQIETCTFEEKVTATGWEGFDRREET